MKVLICGSRGNFLLPIISKAIRDSGFVCDEIISGGARGIDTLAQQYAEMSGLPFHLFKPDWGTYGKKAGVLRNIEMVNAADAVIAIWDGESRGTLSSINYTKKCGKPLYIHDIEG